MINALTLIVSAGAVCAGVWGGRGFLSALRNPSFESSAFLSSQGLPSHSCPWFFEDGRTPGYFQLSG